MTSSSVSSTEAGGPGPPELPASRATQEGEATHQVLQIANGVSWHAPDDFEEGRGERRDDHGLRQVSDRAAQPTATN